MSKSQPPAPVKGVDQKRIQRQRATLGAKWVTTDRELIAERMAQAHKNVKRLVKKTKLKVKDSGEFFIGRKDEIAEIINTTKRTVRATTNADRLPAIIVTGAPGVGKTTLVNEARTRLERDEVTCLKLNTQELKTPQSFSDAFKTATGTTLRKLIQAAPKATGHALAHTVDATASLVVAFGAIANGFPVKPSDIQIQAAANTYKAWLDDRVPTVRDVLGTLAFLHPKGVAFFIDEAQTLATALDTKDPRESTAAAIVQALSTPDGRDTAKIPNATVVFSGLADTPDVIGDLGSFGLDVIQLQPMSRTNAKKLILRELQAATGVQLEPLAQEVSKAWLPTLLDEYAEWTRHTAAAAQAVRTIVKARAYNALTDPEGWAATVTLADKIREQVYDHVRRRTDKYEVSNGIRDTLAQALVRNGKQLTPAQTLRLVLTIRRAERELMGFPQPSEKEQVDDGQSNIRACKRAGLIDQATEDTPDIEKENYYCPVPSLLRNLTDAPKTDLKQMLSWIEQSELNT